MVDIFEYDRLKIKEHMVKGMKNEAPAIERQYAKLQRNKQDDEALNRNVDKSLEMSAHHLSLITRDNQELKSANEKLKKQIQTCHCDDALAESGEVQDATVSSSSTSSTQGHGQTPWYFVGNPN